MLELRLLEKYLLDLANYQSQEFGFNEVLLRRLQDDLRKLKPILDKLNYDYGFFVENRNNKKVDG